MSRDSYSNKRIASPSFITRADLQECILSGKSYEERERTCSKCFALNPKFRCSRCKNTYYCNVTCQRDDYSFHKILCKAKPSKDNVSCSPPQRSDGPIIEYSHEFTSLYPGSIGNDHIYSTRPDRVQIGMKPNIMMIYDDVDSDGKSKPKF
jgi:hypothetical protein